MLGEDDMEASGKIEKGASKTILMLILMLILVGGIYYAYTQSASFQGRSILSRNPRKMRPQPPGCALPCFFRSAYHHSTSKWKQSKRK